MQHKNPFRSDGGIDLSKIPYVKDQSAYSDSLVDSLNAEYRAHQGKYDRFNELRKNAVVSPENVRLATLFTVASIKTRTSYVDEASDRSGINGNFSIDKDVLETSHDGELKWDIYHDWFTSQTPNRIAELLEEGKVEKAHALLSGRDPNTGENVGDFYLRACKASLVLYLLGFKRVCMDTRIYNSLKPQIREMMDYGKKVQHPHTSYISNPYREKGPYSANKVPILSHSGDPDYDGNQSFWEDRMKWNVKEYTALTNQMVFMNLGFQTEAPASVLPQVLFNLNNKTTHHFDLMERLQE